MNPPLSTFTNCCCWTISVTPLPHPHTRTHTHQRSDKLEAPEDKSPLRPKTYTYTPPPVHYHGVRSTSEKMLLSW